MIWQIRASHKYKNKRKYFAVNEFESECKLKTERKIRGELFFRFCTFILTFVKWKQNQQNFISTHKN